MRVAVTGAAGQIGYSLLFRIANGDMLGKDQPVILQLLDLPQAQNAVKGVVMELEDCAFELLQGIVITDDPKIAFKDADLALLVGASLWNLRLRRPRPETLIQLRQARTKGGT